MEMTKMLLPSTVPSVATIHGNDKYNFYRSLKTHYHQQILLSKIREKLQREKRENIFMVNCRQLLQTNLAPNYESQRVACPSANEEVRYYKDIPTIGNAEKFTKFQDAILQWTSGPKLEPVQQPEPELKPKPEPEPKPEPQPKPEPEPKSNPESEVEPKLEPKPELELQTKPELELVTDFEIGLEQTWKQELEKESEPNPLLNLEWDSEDDMMTSSEVYKACIMSDSENDSLTKCQMDFRQLHEIYAKKYKKLKKRKHFISREKAKRMLSNTITFQLPSYNVQTSASNLANRSLLKSQQNSNILPSTISSSKYNYFQLLSDNQEKKIHDQNQDYEEKIVTSYNQQIKEEKEEKNQDDEMKQLLNDDNLLVSDADEEDQPIFRHDQISVSQKLSEYISETSMMNGSLKNKKYTSQQIKRHWRKNEENQRQNDIKRNTLSDHCYHLNEPKSVERLKMEELSESDEEEIDVVSYEKQATCTSFARNQRNKAAKQIANTDDTTTFRRPRGRPPGVNSAKRKRDAQAHRSSPVPKRARLQSHQRINRRQRYVQQDENQADNENNQKRHMHNSMERERRISLKKSFDTLKTCIPEIENSQKVSKVSILKHARKYSIELYNEILNDEADLENLIEKHKRLHKIAKFKGIELACGANCFLKRKRD